MSGSGGAVRASEASAVPKVAVVDGTGSGHGRVVALELADADRSVALAGRRREALAETARRAGREGAGVAIPTDVARPEQVTRCSLRYGTASAASPPCCSTTRAATASRAGRPTSATRPPR